jgi:5-methylcytosine-specific restriction protein A
VGLIDYFYFITTINTQPIGVLSNGIGASIVVSCLVAVLPLWCGGFGIASFGSLFLFGRDMQRAKSICCHPGCGRLIDAPGYCKTHAIAAKQRMRERMRRYAKTRESANERGYDGKWRKARTTFLNHHPLCLDCQKRGRITPAVVVDHIVPHKGDMELFWDENNWQPLCVQCHGRKTAKFDGGFGNPINRRGE